MLPASAVSSISGSVDFRRSEVGGSGESEDLWVLGEIIRSGRRIVKRDCAAGKSQQGDLGRLHDEPS